ncbi:MAG: type I glutamate--ammonia ligase [Thermodesulfobacteriota bacterium]|nr:type I glutamate--ammonia ligase [Thermodesulfobacteriota bacterium]
MIKPEGEEKMLKETKQEVLKTVKEQDVKFIRLWFTDILGQVKSFAITDAELEGALENGMGFDGSSITGYQSIEESDMLAVPDPATFQILPWRPQEKKVARMICDIFTPERKPYEGDPRYVLKRALERMKKMGFDHCYLGPELEYFYFKNDTSSTEILDKGGYFDLTTLDVASDLRRDTVFALEAMGIPVEYSHHEVGPSQHEIDMKYTDALDMADHVVTYRIVVKEIAQKYGVYATFMPKPLFGENGSGMHVHQSLFKGDKNSFFSKDDKYHLSEIAKKFIAGQLRHAREMSAVFAQWMNSYKRLVPGYEAPVYIAWSRRNRSALIRVPVYHPGKEKATRAELRCPDPACNPYLTFAVMLHAGLDGIEKEYKIAEPMEKNLYHLSDVERKELGIESLPDSLGEAVLIAEQSELIKRALGDHVFTRFIELKKKEWEDYRIQLTKYELDKLLSVL